MGGNTHIKKKPRNPLLVGVPGYVLGIIGKNWNVKNSGGGGNRTPVRKCLSRNVYMRSLLFGLVPENSSRQD